jgi:hypothetical protein
MVHIHHGIQFRYKTELKSSHLGQCGLELEIIMLSEVSQVQKVSHDLTHI